MKTFEEKIKRAIEESVAKNPELFIVQLDISPDQNVNVIIDGKKAVPLSECVRINREVEEKVDRDEHNYALTVGTFDITQWFNDPRQFEKNLNRKMKIKTPEGEFTGRLTEITDKGIVIEEKVREPKPAGKGKHTVTKRYEIPFNQIEKAKVMLEF